METSELAGVDESPVITTAARPAVGACHGRRGLRRPARRCPGPSAGRVAATPAQAGLAGGQRAAVSYAQVLTSIDSNKVDENFKDVLDGATGEFKRHVLPVQRRELRQLLIENKAIAHGVVADSAVQEASKNKAIDAKGSSTSR